VHVLTRGVAPGSFGYHDVDGRQMDRQYSVSTPMDWPLSSVLAVKLSLTSSMDPHTRLWVATALSSR